MKHPKKVLLTGATGFVGRHLHPVLTHAGYPVVGATRNPDRARRDFPERDYCYLDAEDPRSIGHALKGVGAVVYLIHTMGTQRARSADYEKVEASAAAAFREAAEREGVRRIVYLGGMRPRGAQSKHIRSRLATGSVLRAGRVSTLELRAGMIVGGGSQSWRIVRDLAARLPLMALPRWLDSESQPIGINDVVQAILHALALDMEGSSAFDLPGPETMSTREVLERTARLMGSKPYMFSVPLVSPRLSTHWIRLVTRANPSIARELVDGLLSDLVASGDDYFSLMPSYARTPFDDAAIQALAEEGATLSRGARRAERVLQALTPSREPYSVGSDRPCRLRNAREHGQVSKR